MPNVKSDIFANQYPLVPPRLLSPSLISRGAVYFTKAQHTKAVADTTAGTLFPVMRLPAHARILALFVAHDAIASMTDMDLGLFPATDWTDPAMANPTALDADIYADAITFATARNVMVDGAQALATAATNSIFNVLGRSMGTANSITGSQWARQVWQDALLVATPTATEPRPGTEYDLVWTGNTIGASGPVVFNTGVLYVMGA